MKIERIKVKNLKAVNDIDIHCNCRNVLIFGGNNKGKTTILRYLPEYALGKAIATEGQCEWQLSDGSRLIYDSGKLIYYTNENKKQNVTKKLARQLFNQYLFDIDEYLNKTRKERLLMLYDVFNIRHLVEQLDEQYAELDKQRLDAFQRKRAAQKLKEENYCEPVEYSDESLSHLHALLHAKIKEKERTQKELYEKEKQEVDEYNRQILSRYEQEKEAYERYNSVLNEMKKFAQLLDKYELFKTKDMLRNEFVEKFGKPPKEPQYPQLRTMGNTIFNIENDEEIKQLKEQIKELETKRAQWLLYRNYKNLENQYVEVYNEWKQLDEECKKIDEEKRKILSSIPLPKGITIENGEIKHNGYLIDKSVLSTSQLYIAAMKLATISIGEVRCITFDASVLDKDSMKDIIEYCNANDLQLLVEKVDYEGGDIVYEFIEEN